MRVEPLTAEDRAYTVPYFTNPFKHLIEGALMGRNTTELDAAVAVLAAVNQHNVEQANAAVNIARAYIDIYDRLHP